MYAVYRFHVLCNKADLSSSSFLTHGGDLLWFIHLGFLSKNKPAYSCPFKQKFDMQQGDISHGKELNIITF